MSVLIKDMGKPKSCYAVIDGEYEYCPFVNTDDDCVLLLKKGTCEGTWADQYSKCPLIEAPELCEDAVSRQQAIDSLESIGSLDTEADKKYARSVFEALPSAQPDIKQAAKLLSDFIESCPCGDSYLIAPDGEALRTDWGYATEGIQLIHDWAERRTDGGGA